MNNQAHKLRGYIERLNDFKVVAPDIPYNHMGATICDAVLQAGLNWESVVRPRLEKIKKQFPDCCTTTGFRNLLSVNNIKEVIDWNDDEKPRRITGIITFFIEEGIETEIDLRKWLEQDQNLPRLKQLRGVGDKTADYFKWLVGIPTSAVDRHMINFLRAAELTPRNYQDAQEIIHATADLMNLNRTVLDHSIWKYMSSLAQDVKKKKRGPVECGTSTSVLPHSGEMSLNYSFDHVWDYLDRNGLVTLRTRNEKSFESVATVLVNRPVIKFLQNGKEYARAFQCCWGHYYNCSGTRFGMYARALNHHLKSENAVTPLRTLGVTLDKALEEAARNGRVCPQPIKWKELYDILPGCHRVGGGWEPALPLILSAWGMTSDWEKKMRLREHLEWAKSHNCLESIYAFLLGLSENDWYHA